MKQPKLLVPFTFAMVSTFIMAAITIPVGAQAAIYKVVDKQTGQIIYTDQPGTYILDNQKTIYAVEVPSQAMQQPTQRASVAPNAAPAVNNTTNATPLTAKPSSQVPKLNGMPINMTTQPASSWGDYQLSIITPQPEQTYQRPAQTIDIELAVAPELSAPDTIQIYIDGEPVTQGTTASIATVDLLPGEHVISAKIINKNGDNIAEANQKVYVILNTQIMRQKKQLAQQLKAYQQLPWYQKVLLKMRQKEGANTNDGNQQKTSSAFD